MSDTTNPYVAVREWAAEFNKFSLEDEHVKELLHNTLYLEHHDGHILQHHAFYIEKEFFGVKFFVLFGEHLKPDVHCADEVHKIAMFQVRYPMNEGPADDDDEDLECSDLSERPEDAPYVICPQCRNWAARPGKICNECERIALKESYGSEKS